MQACYGVITCRDSLIAHVMIFVIFVDEHKGNVEKCGIQRFANCRFFYPHLDTLTNVVKGKCQSKVFYFCINLPQPSCSTMCMPKLNGNKVEPKQSMCSFNHLSKTIQSQSLILGHYFDLEQKHNK